eukprot:comp24335_c0_seq1/m.46097 comp24335_c0_seq1/g.46097  ORF comp24335_c0_seq1/g.46097 comp24335_c0_seq1/m.46097 type:complete len:317 (+) comp24335_c0_seq1:2098-3048(+)
MLSQAYVLRHLPMAASIATLHLLCSAGRLTCIPMGPTGIFLNWRRFLWISARTPGVSAPHTFMLFFWAAIAWSRSLFVWSICLCSSLRYSFFSASCLFNPSSSIFLSLQSCCASLRSPSIASSSALFASICSSRCLFSASRSLSDCWRRVSMRSKKNFTSESLLFTVDLHSIHLFFIFLNLSLLVLLLFTSSLSSFCCCSSCAFFSSRATFLAEISSCSAAFFVSACCFEAWMSSISLARSSRSFFLSSRSFSISATNAHCSAFSRYASSSRCLLRFLASVNLFSASSVALLRSSRSFLFWSMVSLMITMPLWVCL